jgi:putative DNA primase/helicase
VAFVAGPRAAFAVVRDPGDKARRLFLPTKTNLGPDGQPGLAFRIGVVETASGIFAPTVVWDGEGVTMTADEALAAASVTRGAPARASAEGFLRELLKDGPKAATDIRVDAEGAGFAWATIRRAKATLGVDAAKVGIQGDWFWSLPAKGSRCSPVRT